MKECSAKSSYFEQLLLVKVQTSYSVKYQVNGFGLWRDKILYMQRAHQATERHFFDMVICGWRCRTTMVL